MNTHNLRRALRVLFIAAIPLTAMAATFNYFSPATGILKGSSTTYVTTAAASSDVVGLFSGCSGVQYLGADGACHAAGGSGTVTNVATGTGLTGGPITTTGTISLVVPVVVSNGGTGATTLTGPLKGNGTSAITAAAAADIVGLFSGCSGVQYLGADGACHAAGGASFANPTALVGLTAVNGVASTAMRSDAAPALDQNISPTWTNFHDFSAGASVEQTSGTAFIVTGTSTAEAVAITGDPTTGQSRGLTVNAGTNSGDYALNINNQTAGTQFFVLFGDGGSVYGNATGGDKGLGTINATGLYINGTAVGTGVTQTSGTYTATYSTGCTTSPTATAQWVRTNSQVTIHVASLGTCTGNSTLSSLDASVPAAERPASTQCVLAINAEDNGTKVTAMVRVTTGGVIDFDTGGTTGNGCAGAGWTSSGTRAPVGQGFTITYQIAN